MLSFLSFPLLISSVASHPTFEQFVIMYDKQYKNHIEYNQKKNIYEKNVEKINTLNEKHNDLNFSVNVYGDFNVEEFNTKIKGYIWPKPVQMSRTKSCEPYEYQESWLPSSWDWREQGSVTSVKNQGQCGSCWSFSAVGSMEGAWSISTGKLVNISEQQLMDCSTKYMNFGCNGGVMDHAFEYAIDNGMCLDDEVPYTAQTSSCETCSNSIHFSSCFDVPSQNQLALEEAVHFVPVSVAIEADTSVFQFYKEGILTSSKCGNNLDHGVLVVGYGIEDDQAYWIVKNSWGESWGENGYIRIAKSSSTTEDGVCGIALQPSSIQV